MLDSIVTLDKTIVSFYTPETKKQSKQWMKNGRPGPIKAKVYSGRTKQMVLAFFNSKVPNLHQHDAQVYYRESDLHYESPG